ncbi:MAG TPA: hypothetical protein P5136_06335 [Methanofastidiosum sp.]|nr:hypothetical protein [Methanofastidiosum sp.]
MKKGLFCILFFIMGLTVVFAHENVFNKFLNKAFFGWKQAHHRIFVGWVDFNIKDYRPYHYTEYEWNDLNIEINKDYIQTLLKVYFWNDYLVIGADRSGQLPGYGKYFIKISDVFIRSDFRYLSCRVDLIESDDNVLIQTEKIVTVVPIGVEGLDRRDDLTLLFGDLAEIIYYKFARSLNIKIERLNPMEL